jgi:hypothetical protein
MTAGNVPGIAGNCPQNKQPALVTGLADPYIPTIHRGARTVLRAVRVR